MACLVVRPRAKARPWPIVLTAREADRITPRVALANDSTRLACRSPSKRLLRKLCTPSKPMALFAVIACSREFVTTGDSLLARSRQAVFVARKNANLARAILILSRKRGQLSGFFCYAASSTYQ